MTLLSKTTKINSIACNAKAQSDLMQIKSRLRSSVSMRSMAIVMMTAGVIALSGTDAEAACTVTSPGVWDCTGVLTATQSPTSATGRGLSW